MRPLHVGLLVVGAALAGGLAVRMSQPPTFQTAAAAPAPSTTANRAAQPVPAPNPPQATAVAPPPVYASPAPVYTEAVEVPIPAPKPHPFAPAPKTLALATPRVAPMAISSAPYQPPAPAPEPQAAAPEPAPATAAPEPEPPHEAPKPEPPPEPRRVTLHQGFQITIRLDESISTDHAAGGDTFRASLAEPLVADGLIIAERGARVTGRVVNAIRGGRFSGPAELQLALATVETSDGQKVAISTEPWVKTGEGSRAGALGAIIGAISGGGDGASRPLDLPNDTVIRFRLATRITITERPI